MLKTGWETSRTHTRLFCECTIQKYSQTQPNIHGDCKSHVNKDNPTGKALEVSEFTNGLRQSEAQKLEFLHHSCTLVNL